MKRSPSVRICFENPWSKNAFNLSICDMQCFVEKYLEEENVELDAFDINGDLLKIKMHKVWNNGIYVFNSYLVFSRIGELLYSNS